MSKKHQKRKWIGRIKRQEPEFWIKESQMAHDFAFLEKLHGETEGSIQALIEQGFISARINEDGEREFRFNREAVEEARSKLPSEVRNNPREIKIYKSVAAICNYDNEMTNLLSVIIQQNNALSEGNGIAPWINKTLDQLKYDTMDLIPDLQHVLNQLEAKNFIDLAQNGPEQFRYRLNTDVIQATIDALPRDEVGE